MAQKKFTLPLHGVVEVAALEAAVDLAQQRHTADMGRPSDPLKRIAQRLSDATADPKTLDAPKRADEGASQAQDDDGTAD